MEIKNVSIKYDINTVMIITKQIIAMSKIYHEMYLSNVIAKCELLLLN